jgi:transposase
MRKAVAINLSEAEIKLLESYSKGRSCSVRLAERSKVVLLSVTGLENREIGKRLGITRQKVGRWRNRFAQLGFEGIKQDAPRPGRFPKITSNVTKRVVRLTLEHKPESATHWSRTSMASETGLSPSSIGRIWAANGLKPHLIKTFKLSNDKQFVEKLEDIVGLYLSPPEHAIVLSCDEKSQIQALDRTQPGLPLWKGRCGTTSAMVPRRCLPP